MSDVHSHYRITKGEGFQLSRFKPSDTATFEQGKKQAESRFLELNQQLEALQELLHADKRHRLLVVLQGMDTSGKDGAIRHIFDRTNPAGVRVAAFKKPSATELAHDYLWRVHAQVPESGEIVIFNRSHYEDVLVARVDNLVPEKRWKARYRHIREFERMLADEGVTILKFFLHISKDEQKERLQERLDDKEKRWKFDMADLAAREKWADYQEAYQDAIAETSTEYAPWYIIPADKKWYRNLVISDILVETLQAMKLRAPEAPNLDGVVIV